MYQEKDESMKSNPDLYFNSATVSCVFDPFTVFHCVQVFVREELDIEYVNLLFSCIFAVIFISSTF